MRTTSRIQTMPPSPKWMSIEQVFLRISNLRLGARREPLYSIISVGVAGRFPSHTRRRLSRACKECLWLVIGCVPTIVCTLSSWKQIGRVLPIPCTYSSPAYLTSAFASSHASHFFR